MGERLDTEEGRWLAVLRGRRAAGAYAVATLEDVERLIAERDAARAQVGDVRASISAHKIRVATDERDEASARAETAEAALAEVRAAAVAYRRAIDTEGGDDWMRAGRRGPRMALDNVLTALPADLAAERDRRVYAEGEAQGHRNARSQWIDATDAEQAGAREIQCLKDIEAVGDALGWMAGEYVHKSLPGAVTELKARAEHAEAQARNLADTVALLRESALPADLALDHDRRVRAEAGLAALREAAFNGAERIEAHLLRNDRAQKGSARKIMEKAIAEDAADTAQAAEAYTRRVRAEALREAAADALDSADADLSLPSGDPSEIRAGVRDWLRARAADERGGR